MQSRAACLTRPEDAMRWDGDVGIVVEPGAVDVMVGGGLRRGIARIARGCARVRPLRRRAAWRVAARCRRVRRRLWGRCRPIGWGCRCVPSARGRARSSSACAGSRAWSRVGIAAGKHCQSPVTSCSCVGQLAVRLSWALVRLECMCRLPGVVMMRAAPVRYRCRPHPITRANAGNTAVSASPSLRRPCARTGRS